MKIGSQSNIINSIDFATLISDLESKYRNVFWTVFEGDVYVYKALGRRDYRNIVSNENLSIEDKKDEIITSCIVYPTDFDIDDCIAGLINILFDKIVEISYLKDDDQKASVMQYYRQDMHNLDNQITCVINEAFPNFDIEEIENWDIERTAKYLSRAEYKLQNFRGFTFNDDYLMETASVDTGIEENQQIEEAKEDIYEEPKKDTGKKEKLTPEKLRQLQAQFPEIDWANDAIAKGGVDAMSQTIDTTPPALRPGMF